MELPLFPLHTVLFPGRPLPLHLFEDRYKQLLSDVLDADRRFGVVAIRAGREVGGEAEIFEVGTLTEIEGVTELPDGRFDVSTRGVQRFRVLELLGGTPYLRAHVDVLPEQGCPDSNGRAKELHRLLVPYLAGLGAPRELLCHLPSDPVQLVYLTACALQVDLREQQEILEIDDLACRLDLAVRILRRETSLTRHFGTVGSLQPPGPGGVQLN
jgi:uncharacterized protein